MEGPVDNDRDGQDESLTNFDDLNNVDWWNTFDSTDGSEDILPQAVDPEGINKAHDRNSSAGSSRNVDDFADLEEAPRDLTELPHVLDPDSSLLDRTGKGAEAWDRDFDSEGSAKQTNEKDLSWEHKNSANEEIQKPSEEILSLPLFDKNQIENERGIEQSVPETPERQVADSIEPSVTDPVPSETMLEMCEYPSSPAPSQSVSVSQNTHSLMEGVSSAQLSPHELGFALNRTEEIFSRNERQAEEYADNNSSFSSNNQDSSDNNNDANIIQENPVVVSQNPSSQNNSEGRIEPSGFQAGNLPMYSLANRNIDVIVDGLNLEFTVPPSQEPKTYVVSLANLLQAHPEKRKSSDSDSDYLTEPGPSSPAKRQRAEEREYVSQGTQTCSPVQFPDQFRKMETVDRVKECDAFLKESDNFESCVEMLSQIEGLKSMAKTIATNRVMEELLTNSCAKKFNWAGQNKTSKKIGIKSYTSFCSAIFKSVDPGHPHSKTVKDAIQVWLKSAPSRK